MANNQANAPLTPAVLHILLALSTQERHGYGIMKQVESDSQGKVKMGPGTLYGSLGRMIEAGLIRESDKKVDPKMDDERRVYYKITGLGQKALAAELERYREVVAVARAPFAQCIDLRLWQMNTLSRDTGTGIGNCSASIRGRTASASRRAWSKHSTTSAVNGAEAGKGLVGFVLWMFVETSAGIIRENVRFIIMQNITRRLVVWAVVVALILLVPL